MIQIDDAGSGSLIGGICIGALRVETSEFYHEIVPVELFKDDSFNNKTYIYYTTSVVKNALVALKANKTEPIQICRGYVFEDARDFLSSQGYAFEGIKIEEPLQSRIEKAFEEYAVSLGLPEAFISYTKYPFHFHNLLKWIYADYENRTECCKTGWKSWHKYGHLICDAYEDYLPKSRYICLRCGSRIQDRSKVKVLRFFSNRSHYIYLHKKC